MRRVQNPIILRVWYLDNVFRKSDKTGEKKEIRNTKNEIQRIRLCNAIKVSMLDLAARRGR